MLRFLGFGTPPWENPDYRVRLDFASRSEQRPRLRFLALHDVHEEVRVAAVKSLTQDADLLEVIRESPCSRSVTTALRLLQSPEHLLEAVKMTSLSESQRLAVFDRIEPVPLSLLRELIGGPLPPQLRLRVFEHFPPGPELDALFKPELPEALARIILTRTENQDLALRAFRECKPFSLRLVAAERLREESTLHELFAQESDPRLRAALIELMRDAAFLEKVLDSEDEEALRAVVARRLQDPVRLRELALTDHNPLVRLAAAERLGCPEARFEVALDNLDPRIGLAALASGNVPDERLLELGQRARHPAVRRNAIERLTALEQLSEAALTGLPIDSRWYARRRLGKVDLHNLSEIRHVATLVNIAREEPLPYVRQMALRQISETDTLRQLREDDPSLAPLITALLSETEGPLGLRFLDIPLRPYQMGLFNVTGSQFAEWKRQTGPAEAAAPYAALGELPVTGLGLAEAEAFCNWLSTRDTAAQYRLPFLHEWRHAALADNPSWYVDAVRAFEKGEGPALLHFASREGRRGRLYSVPNPWGLLDPLGNVLEWVNDRVYSQAWLEVAANLDPLARFESGPDGLPPLQTFAIAAGNHWADKRISAGRWERLIHAPNLAGSAADLVGFRVLRWPIYPRHQPALHRLLLQREVRFGFVQEQVISDAARALNIPRAKVAGRFLVAPTELASAQDYQHLLRIKQSWDRCGANTDIISTPITAEAAAEVRPASS